MVSASRPFLAYVILPMRPGPLSLLSGGGVHTSAPHYIRASAGSNKRVAFEKQTHTIYGQDKGPIIIQPIVLQEGVHTICHCAYVCQQRGSCILMYAYRHIIMLLGPSCDFVCNRQEPCLSHYLD